MSLWISILRFRSVDLKPILCIAAFKAEVGTQHAHFRTAHFRTAPQLGFELVSEAHAKTEQIHPACQGGSARFCQV